MAHYVIYIPDVPEPADKYLKTVGLDGLVNSDLPIFGTPVMRGGPDGGSGMIFSWGAVADPNRQKQFNWTPSKPDTSRNLQEKRFFFGVDPASPPTPDDLRRKRQFKGHSVRCADGQRWLVPAIQKLPHQTGLNEDGKWQRKIFKNYKEYAERAIGYATQIFAEVDVLTLYKEAHPDLDPEHSVMIDLHEIATHCYQALSINYRVTPEVVDFLGLLDDDTMVSMVTATIDLPEIYEILSQKKSLSSVVIPVGSPT